MDAFRFGPAYTIAQAARLADTSPATVRRWLTGHDAPNDRRAPALGSHDDTSDGPLGVSFLELVEVVVVTQFRRSRRSTSLDLLRRAHAVASERFGLPHPFASRKLREFGGGILRELDDLDSSEPALPLDVGGQFPLPGAVVQTLDRIDFSAEDSLAERWFPAGRDIPIVVDPRIGAGRPTILGSGVTVETIYRRFQAGESIEFLASDYDLDQTAIQAAIHYADRPSVAA